MTQKPGWDREVLQWCLLEARERNMKDQDYWGGFVIDEMKIQVFRMSKSNLLSVLSP